MDIIYCNDQCPDYFLSSLESVVMNNPNSMVHVITGEGVDRILAAGKSVRVYLNHEMSPACTSFDKNYIHKSTNPEYFERACLRRWFLINALVKKLGLKKFVVMDWDMLCFCNFDKEMARFNDRDFTYINKICCGLSLWNNHDALKALVDLIDDTYKTPDVGLGRVILSHYDKLQREGKMGGVCDMTFTGYMVSTEKWKTREMYQIFDDNTCFDNNITQGIGDCPFDQVKQRKIITLRDGKAYCGNVRMNTLHFYNGTKPEMIRCWQEAKAQLLEVKEKEPADCDIAKSYIDLLGIKDGFFVDVGASTNESSNTLALAKAGWRGLAIECDEIKLNELRSEYKLFPGITVSGERVTPSNIVKIMEGVPKDFDFLSFDIDGYDYFVLKEILPAFRPKLAFVEINEKIPPPIKFAVQYADDYKWAGDHFYGMSIAMLCDLCKEEKYGVLNLFYNNAIICPLEETEGSAARMMVNDKLIYEEGYLNKLDRKKKFSYNADMEYLIWINPSKAVEEIKNKFKDKKTPFVCEL